MSKPLSGRIALVTGASRGIGAATALALAKDGAHIVAVARTVGGLEELDDRIAEAGSSATLVPLDMKDSEGIVRLAQAIRDRHGKLDILVGNAGILTTPSPIGHIEAKSWDDSFAINVTANWQLLQAFDPLLKKSDAGRAVFITSGVVHLGLAYFAPYAASKSALESLVRTYAAETTATAVRANLFNPGRTNTRMIAIAYPGIDVETLPSAEAVADKIITLCRPDFTETGKLYEFPAGRLLGFQAPA